MDNINTSEISVQDITSCIDMAHECDLTPVFVGESGIGKTEQIRKYCSIKQIDLVELSCSTLFVENFGEVFHLRR